MPQIAYIDKNFRPESLAIIAKANEIIGDYSDQGFDLTLRQLYYQFVARDLIPNTERSYKNLGTVINNARLAGYVDWNAIVDRTRNLRGNSHWDSPAEIVRSCANQFRYDLWEDQEQRVEVWIEKDALVGVIEGVCRRWDVDYFACRGYNSQSEQWRAGQRFQRYGEQAQGTTILHLGDHDPSGIDMTHDNQGRLNLFTSYDTVGVNRIALNMDQIEQYRPPPNPAKLSDARYRQYVIAQGTESCWELDALEPQVLVDLIDSHISDIVNQDKFDAMKAKQEEARERISEIADEMEMEDEQ